MKKILIIEDDTFLGDALIQKFKTSGFETVLSKNGSEGFEKIKSFKPDLILLDIILPGMSGYEILEAKQKDGLITDIPVIIISNSGQPVEISRALALGVKDYVVKVQFDPEEILTKVRAQFEKEARDTPLEKSLDSAMNDKNEATDSNLAGKKIVWVEDDQFLKDIIAQKISMTKCAFFHTSGGEQALQIIERELPDIVMLDIILSGMNGFEILEKLKANPKTKQIPVILLSNLGQPSDIEKGKSLGAIRFLVKATVTPNEIIEEIKKVLAETKK